MFYTTNISVTLWILNKNKKARTVEALNGRIKNIEIEKKKFLFMDLRQIGEPFEKNLFNFTDEIYKRYYSNLSYIGNKKIKTYKNIPEYCYSASLDEVEKKDFSLVPSKYIEFVNRDENIDFDEKMTVFEK